MSESHGWWYDRRKKKFVKISDHAEAVINNPSRYRVSRCRVNGEPLIRMETILRPYKYREEIIARVCANGFIRVRLIKGHTVNTLGWQFIGEPHNAFQILRRFAKRHGVGPLVEVTFTDFGLGRNLTTFWKDFDPEKPPLKTFLDHWEEIHWPSKQWSERTKKDLRAHNGKDLEEVLNKEMRRAGR